MPQEFSSNRMKLTSCQSTCLNKNNINPAKKETPGWAACNVSSLSVQLSGERAGVAWCRMAWWELLKSLKTRETIWQKVQTSSTKENLGMLKPCTFCWSFWGGFFAGLSQDRWIGVPEVHRGTPFFYNSGKKRHWKGKVEKLLAWRLNKLLGHPEMQEAASR